MNGAAREAYFLPDMMRVYMSRVMYSIRGLKLEEAVMTQGKKIETAKTFDPRTSTYVDELLCAPVMNPLPDNDVPDGFYPKGNKVCYRSGYFLSGEDPQSEAPEEVLLTTCEIKGNYGPMLSADMVAQMMAGALNKYREELLIKRGHRPALKPEVPAE